MCYQFTRRNGQLPATRSYSMRESGGGHVLAIKAVGAADSDEYFCLATNPAGEARAAATLTVHCEFQD